MNKRWIAYGVSGVLGLGVIAAAATVTAQAMELRTDEGSVIDGGGIEAGLLVTPPASPPPSATPTPSRTPQPEEPVVDQPVTTGEAPVTVTPPSPVSVESAPSAD